MGNSRKPELKQKGQEEAQEKIR